MSTLGQRELSTKYQGHLTPPLPISHLSEIEQVRLKLLQDKQLLYYCKPFFVL